MSSKASEEMMGLLQELALLKQAEAADEGPRVQSIESQGRQNRRREIADRIKALGEPAR
jgi:hypothetical protein